MKTFYRKLSFEISRFAEQIKLTDRSVHKFTSKHSIDNDAAFKCETYPAAKIVFGKSSQCAKSVHTESKKSTLNCNSNTVTKCYKHILWGVSCFQGKKLIACQLLNWAEKNETISSYCWCYG